MTQEVTPTLVRNARKEKVGIVLSNKMEKTVVIAIKRKIKHPKYHKFMTKTIKIAAHDDKNIVNIGDVVKVMETRPLSKIKRWRIVEIIEKAK